MLTYYGQAKKRAQADANAKNRRSRKFKYSVMGVHKKGGVLKPGYYLVKSRKGDT